MEPNSLLPMLMGYAPIILIFAVFYFLVMKPQSDAAKAHTALLEALKKGDTVLTVGGLMGRIEHADPASIRLKVNHEDTVLMARSSVERLLSESETKLLQSLLAESPAKKK